MKKYLLPALAVLTGVLIAAPALTGVLDILTWFWTGHQATSIEWAYNEGIRVVLAFVSSLIGATVAIAGVFAILDTVLERA